MKFFFSLVFPFILVSASILLGLREILARRQSSSQKRDVIKNWVRLVRRLLGALFMAAVGVLIYLGMGPMYRTGATLEELKLWGFCILMVCASLLTAIWDAFEGFRDLRRFTDSFERKAISELSRISGESEEHM